VRQLRRIMGGDSGFGPGHLPRRARFLIAPRPFGRLAQP